ncbi:MAG TPA: hypothetical protein DDW50_07930 [Firmicutes bacterium]|jgi:hypothetical protein|nr:hypothetical protein [Bacillota bacterium]
MTINYIWLLLLIAPGFACRSIYEYLNSGGYQENGVRLILSSLFYSVWVLVMNYGFLLLTFHIKNFAEIQILFNNILFVIYYLFITIISCVVVALVWNFIHPYLTLNFVNAVRHGQQKPDISVTPLWDVFQKNQNQAVVIWKGRQIMAKGIITVFNSAYNTRRELLIIPSDKIEDNYPAEELKEVYVDCDNDLVIQIVNPHREVVLK